jgi:hypothetical protein
MGISRMQIFEGHNLLGDPTEEGTVLSGGARKDVAASSSNRYVRGSRLCRGLGTAAESKPCGYPQVPAHEPFQITSPLSAFVHRTCWN